MNTVIQAEIDKIVVSITKIQSWLNNIPDISPVQPVPAPAIEKTELVRLEDSEYIEIHTSSDNCYITQEFLSVLTFLLQSNFREFPYREFKKLYISAAGRQDGVDTVGLHGEGKAIDAHYFSFGEPILNIDGKVTAMFDLKRQLSFVKAFIDSIREPIIYMNDQIYFALLLVDKSQAIKTYVHPAGGHDDHIHLGYKGEILA